MTDYAVYQSFAVDTAGNTMSGASVEVRSETSGSLVGLFSGRTGGALANPFTTDSDGYFKFHTVGDFLKVRIYTGPSATPTTERIFRYVPVGMSGGYDVNTILRAVPDGTVGAPGLAFSVSPTTGAYSPGANIWAISTAGVERFRVNASGAASLTGTLSVTGATTLGATTISGGLTLSGPTTLANTTLQAGRIPTSSTVTISNASPAVITWTSNGLAANTPVFFSTTGTLPTGLTAAVPGSGALSANTYLSNPTLYYVKNILSANTFTVSATMGGSEINTSSAGSGTHTAFANAMTPAGYVGEYIYNIVTAAGGFSLTSGSGGQVWNSISLTAGIWLVGASSGVIKLTSTPTITHMHSDVVYGFTTIASSPYNGSAALHVTSNDPNGWIITNNPEVIFLTATTTLNATMTADFSGGTLGAYGKLWARRIA